MCLPVSRFFWVSSLAYPNLLGTKGYVVVVAMDDLTLKITQRQSYAKSLFSDLLSDAIGVHV
jgi:hypothetical protein